MKAIYKIKVDEGFTISDFQVSRTDTEIEITYEKTEKPFTPKDGDIIFVRIPEYGIEAISIVKRFDESVSEQTYVYCSVIFKNGTEKFKTESYYKNGHARLANDEEKEILFDWIEKNGLEWIPETKTLVNKRWRAAKGEKYFHISSTLNEIFSKPEQNILMDYDCYKNGNYFQTRKEAEEYRKKIINLLTKR